MMFSSLVSSRYISIHALREESDVVVGGVKMLNTIFLSTPSARRATPPTLLFRLLRSLFLSTPSARRATQQFVCGVDFLVGFLSTPSARRATGSFHIAEDAGVVFLSTPSARRATQSGCCRHLPAQNFYPRPPRGERPRNDHHGRRQKRFLSTPSARRATFQARFWPFPGGFLSTPSARRATHDDHPRPP